MVRKSAPFEGRTSGSLKSLRRQQAWDLLLGKLVRGNVSVPDMTALGVTETA
jgi:hypothetical protein